MTTRISAGLVTALLLLASTQPTTADEPLKADPDVGIKLLRDGDSLADKGNPTEAVIRYQEAFEQLLPGMRKLPFHHEVKRDVTPREELRALLAKEFDEEQTPGEFHGNEVGMKALGLIPRDLDLKEIMLKIYTEEIAAFYDTKTKTMHLIKEPEAKKKKAPSLLERLMGKTGEFDKDENKIVIAHELTHALADQNFDLDKLHESAKGDDDRDLALSALIEGEASLTMFGAQMTDWDGNKIARYPAESWNSALGLMNMFMPMMSGPSMKKAPAILSESLIFPYFKGMVFCAHLTNTGGWNALSAAFHEPPLSTEQVLHPEKYRDSPDPPINVDLGRLDVPDGWKEVVRNVVGEMQLGVMLRAHNGKRTAAGWDGDTFAAFEGPDDRLGLVWLTTWDTEKDAHEFVESYLKFQASRIDPDGPDRPTPLEDYSRLKHKGAIYALERRGMDVAIAEGFPGEATERLLEAAFRSKKTEKTNAEPARPKKEAEEKRTKRVNGEASARKAG
jgi:hypothetical protein